MPADVVWTTGRWPPQTEGWHLSRWAIIIQEQGDGKSSTSAWIQLHRLVERAFLLSCLRNTLLKTYACIIQAFKQRYFNSHEYYSGHYLIVTFTYYYLFNLFLEYWLYLYLRLIGTIFTSYVVLCHLLMTCAVDVFPSAKRLNSKKFKWKQSVGLSKIIILL